MGIEAPGMLNQPVVASEEVVLKTLASRGVTVVQKTASGRSWLVRRGRIVFFIPAALQGGGYTQAQLDFIEACCADCGVDLLPLDYHLI